MLACLSSAEFWISWILAWTPFYAWIRLGLLLYLLLPITQGAQRIYTSQLEPFIALHEKHWDHLAEGTFSFVRNVGWRYIHQAISLTKIYLLGWPTGDSVASDKMANKSDSLLAQFNLPQAGAESTATGTSYASLLSLLGQMISPKPTLESKQEQRAQLRDLLATLDEELNEHSLEKSKSEASFEEIGHGHADPPTDAAPSGLLSWFWTWNADAKK